jgi:hypothetical protein
MMGVGNRSAIGTLVERRIRFLTWYSWNFRLRSRQYNDHSRVAFV